MATIGRAAPLTAFWLVSFRLLLLLAAGLLLVTVLLVWRLDSQRLAPVVLTPRLTGQPEYCLTCHAGLPEISPSHPVETFGCVLCHGGERLALEAGLAHANLRGGANPSDLAVVEQSCGGTDCHSGPAEDQRDHIQRVTTSVQSTYAGAIANIRYSFGAQPDLVARYGIQAIADPVITTQTGLPALEVFDPGLDSNPAIQQFAGNCLTCHLNAAPRDGAAYARYTGCASCHTPTAGLPASSSQGEVHRLTTAIAYPQCNTCHNRGNYDLRQMTFAERADAPVLRVDDYYQPMTRFTQCEYTLDCIDCHTRSEAMGDGDLHSSKHEVQYVQCQTCHGTPTELPRTRTLTSPDDLAFSLAALNPVLDLKVGDAILVTGQGEPLWNTRLLPDGAYQMVGKATRQVFTFRPVKGSQCTQSGEDQSSAACHECHAVER